MPIAIGNVAMNQTAIVLTLPEEVVQKFRQKAAEGQRTLEDIMVETLTSHQPETDDDDQLLAPLATYTDEQLWAVVHEELTLSQHQRLDMLNDKLESSVKFSIAENNEMKQLTQIILQQMVLRSRALVLLKKRRHDVSRFVGGKS
jgi:hypothetical protein